MEELVPPGPPDKEALVGLIRGIVPKGMTPITFSVRKVAEGLKGTPGETTIILVSDGGGNLQGGSLRSGPGIESLRRKICHARDRLRRERKGKGATRLHGQCGRRALLFREKRRGTQGRRPKGRRKEGPPPRES